MLLTWPPMEGQAGPDPLTTWELSTTGFGARGMAYGKGVFVTVYPASISTNGLDWQDILVTRTEAAKVAFGGGGFVGAGDGDTCCVAASADGYTWQYVKLEQGPFYYGLFYFRSRFWLYGRAFSEPGFCSWTSVDGLSWKTNQNQPDTLDWRFLPGNGRIVALAGSQVRVSPDGLRWTTLAIESGRVLRPLIYGDGTYFALSSVARSNRLEVVGLTSKDLRNWTEHDIPQTDSLKGGLYANGTFVAYGPRGVILTSPDAETWTLRSIPTNRVFSCAAFGQGRFVLGGEGIIRSGVMPPAVERAAFLTRACRRLADGAMLLTVEAPYGRTVTVEASADLRSWQSIATDPCDKGEFEVYDEETKNGKQRFYRAKQQGTQSAE